MEDKKQVQDNQLSEDQLAKVSGGTHTPVNADRFAPLDNQTVIEGPDDVFQDIPVQHADAHNVTQ